jgi:DNA polymerase/3'-5' exonuclease PolX
MIALHHASEIAEKVKAELAPHCLKIEIAGAIRRKAKTVNDIDIVAIPKPYETGLFENGIAKVVNQWPRLKGTLPCKYTQRLLPEGIKLDLFFAKPENWGLILAIRTGSADFAYNVLAKGWVRCGYKSKEGFLYRDGQRIEIPTEKKLFNLSGFPQVTDPEKRA